MTGAEQNEDDRRGVGAEHVLVCISYQHSQRPLVTLCDNGLELAQLHEIAAVVVAASEPRRRPRSARWAWWRGERRGGWVGMARRAGLARPRWRLVAGVAARHRLRPGRRPLLALPAAADRRLDLRRAVAHRVGADRARPARPEDAQAVGLLPADEQHDRRARDRHAASSASSPLAALVIAFLALRVLVTA